MCGAFLGWHPSNPGPPRPLSRASVLGLAEPPGLQCRGMRRLALVADLKKPAKISAASPFAVLLHAFRVGLYRPCWRLIHRPFPADAPHLPTLGGIAGNHKRGRGLTPSGTCDCTQSMQLPASDGLISPRQEAYYKSRLHPGLLAELDALSRLLAKMPSKRADASGVLRRILDIAGLVARRMEKDGEVAEAAVLQVRKQGLRPLPRASQLKESQTSQSAEGILLDDLIHERKRKNCVLGAGMAGRILACDLFALPSSSSDHCLEPRA